MRRKYVVTIGLGMIAVLSLGTVALAEDGRAAFQKRHDTMKEMGRALYLVVGRVTKGRSEYGPDTIAAAENLARLVTTIGTLFPPGSDVADSNMKPSILAAPDKVAQLVAAVQAAMPEFVVDVKSGDKARIAAAYTMMTKACDACHSDFRKEE